MKRDWISKPHDGSDIEHKIVWQFKDLFFISPSIITLTYMENLN